MTLPFDTLSFSSISAFGGFGGCEYAWYYDRVEKVERAPKGPPLWAGSVWDRVVGAAIQRRIDGHAVSREDAMDMFGDAVRAVTDNPDPYDTYVLDQTAEQQEQVSRVIAKGPGIAADWADKVLATLRPIAVQHEVDLSFAEVPWRLVGKIDYLGHASSDPADGEVIEDHKMTLGSSRKFEADGDLQLALYDLARTLQGGNVVSRGFRALRLLKTKAEHVQSHVPSTDASRETTLDLLTSISGRMEQACESGLFLPTGYLQRSWKCAAKYCDHWNRCPYGAKARTSVAVAGGATGEQPNAEDEAAAAAA